MASTVHDLIWCSPWHECDDLVVLCATDFKKGSRPNQMSLSQGPLPGKEMLCERVDVRRTLCCWRQTGCTAGDGGRCPGTESRPWSTASMRAPQSNDRNHLMLPAAWLILEEDSFKGPQQDVSSANSVHVRPKSETTAEPQYCDSCCSKALTLCSNNIRCATVQTSTITRVSQSFFQVKTVFHGSAASPSLGSKNRTSMSPRDKHQVLLCSRSAL